MIGRILCLLGIHKYEDSDPLSTDVSPMEKIGVNVYRLNFIRYWKCKFCGKKADYGTWVIK